MAKPQAKTTVTRIEDEESLDLILGTAVACLEAAGEPEAAAVLELASLDVTKDGSLLLPTWHAQLFIDARFLASLREHEEAVNAALRDALGGSAMTLLFLTIRPAFVGSGWREARQEEQSVGITNQGARVPAHRKHFLFDGYKFLSEAEVAVYRLLKVLQKELPALDTFSFSVNIPWITIQRDYVVDFLLTRSGRSLVIEVDGPSHRKRYQGDSSKDALLRDGGIRDVVRIPAEDTGNEVLLRKHLTTALKRLVVR